MENNLNIPWEVVRETMGWVIRDCNNKVIFIPQHETCEKEKEACLVVCVAINNAFSYMSGNKNP